MQRKRNNLNLVVVPFIIAIDTREQAAWNFRGLQGDSREGYSDLLIRTQTKTLQTGDYSIAGLENRVTVERKSLEDAFGTFGEDRERWERELVRMAAFDFSSVIIEADWPSIFAHKSPPSNSGRQFTPKHFYRSIIAWQQRFSHVHWWFCRSRTFAERTCFQILRRFWEDCCKSDRR